MIIFCELQSSRLCSMEIVPSEQANHETWEVHDLIGVHDHMTSTWSHDMSSTWSHDQYMITMIWVVSSTWSHEQYEITWPVHDTQKRCNVQCGNEGSSNHEHQASVDLQRLILAAERNRPHHRMHSPVAKCYGTPYPLGYWILHINPHRRFYTQNG